MPGVKPKVGPKKGMGPKPVPFQPKPFPEKRGVKAPPKAKPRRMRSGGAVKKMAKGGAAVRSSCPSKSL